MGTAEVESALVAHPKVSEAAVSAIRTTSKAQGIYAYVTADGREKPTEELRRSWSLGARRSARSLRLT